MVSSLCLVNSVAQTKQNEEKVADYLHEVDKPLARYRNDVDLDKMLKDQERDDDPMLAYMKQKKSKQNIREGKKGLCCVVLEKITNGGSLLPEMITVSVAWSD